MTTLGGFYWSAPRTIFCSFPLVVLAQRTVGVPQTVFSDRVVHMRVVQLRLFSPFQLIVSLALKASRSRMYRELTLRVIVVRLCLSTA